MDPAVLAKLQTEFKPVLDALRANSLELAAIPGLVAARPGWITSGDQREPALVLAFDPRGSLPDVAPFATKYGVKVRATVGSPSEQIRGAGLPSFTSPMLSLLEPTQAQGFAPPGRGTYEPPSGANAPKLTTIDEPMKVTVCASPDAGWPVLRDFFGAGVEKHMTVAMYDFTAKHVEKALLDALEGTN